MQAKFCLIDIDYKDIDDKTVILLFGKTTDGKNVVVIDESYEPYFYVLPDNLEKAKKEITEVLEKVILKLKESKLKKRIFSTRKKSFSKFIVVNQEILTKLET